MTQIEFRRGTAAQWTTANPTLASGEPGFETDTGKMKIGNGSTIWTALAYSGGSGGGTAGAALTANNLSDLASATTARTNLGLGNVNNTSDVNKPVSTAQATADALALAKASNLSDLASAATARTNLGLSGAAVLAVGTTAGTVAAGNDSRFTATAGVRRPGFSIPYGSLAVWDAARAASASAQRDVVCFGDSTTEGVPASGNNTGGWVGKLRALSVAAGVTDGGRGQIDGIYDDANCSAESFAGFVSRTGWAYAGTNSPPGPNTMSSNTVADVLTLQYKTPANAARIRASSNTSTGRLTVKVNGTTVGTFDPWVPVNQAANQGTYGEMVKAFTGLTAGGAGQTFTVTNTGGAPIPAPYQFRTAGTATTGGALAPGSYTYAATFVDATGLETVMSPQANQTVPAGTSTNTVTTACDNSGASAGNVPSGITKTRLYRATGTGITNPASFGMVLETNTSGGAQQVMIDIGNTPGASPPSSTQNPFSNPAAGGPALASISVEFYNSTQGITYQRAGYAGQRYPLLFTPSNSTYALAEYDVQTHLGLLTGLGANTQDWAVEQAAKPNARTPVLAICAFGINDLNVYTSLTSDLQNVTNGVAQFIRFARSAGADPLIVIPHLEYSSTDLTRSAQIGSFRAAILNAADAHGAAWCDFSAALGPVTAARLTSYGNVHLTQTGYDAEATYLWNNVLSAAAAR